jgi:dienelactone hydrolase
MASRLLSLVGAVSMACWAAGWSAQAQTSLDPLPRRAWFGVALGPHERGAEVTAVVEGSTAALEGVVKGDVIEAVDGAAVRAPGDVIAAMTKHTSGQTAVIELRRGGEPLRLTAMLRPLPRESLPGVAFDYSSVRLSDGSRLRTVVTVPEARAGRQPAVLLLQGGGCGSVDVPMAPDAGAEGWLRTIAAQGYVTMRVEKSGVGDSQGPPCAAIGYRQELEGYRAALSALRRHPSVDPARISFLGISLGGVFAPILAADGPVRRIVVFGTLASAPPPYPGRSEQFFREFAAVDVPAAWAAVDARVLALNGQFDEVTVASDHARIAAIVNARRAGRAVHHELAGLDHCGTQHDSMDASRGRCGQGRAVSSLMDAVLGFLAAPE